MPGIEFGKWTKRQSLRERYAGAESGKGRDTVAREVPEARLEALNRLRELCKTTRFVAAS